MPLETFLVVVYGHVCGALQAVIPGGNPRRRGFPPKLSDAEALTMAFVGTILGLLQNNTVTPIGVEWRASEGFPRLPG